MRLRIEKGNLATLVTQTSYRSFIATLIALRKTQGRPLSYAQLSRQLGVKARSYPRDIVLGNKRMSSTLLPGFVKALGLSGDLKSLFIDLVEYEENSCRISGRSEYQISASIEKTRRRILSEASSAIGIDAAFDMAEIPKVYAALGDPVKGASLQEIESRTSIVLERLSVLLDKMVEIGIAEKRGTRFRAKQSHLAIRGLKTSGAFKQHFLKVTEEAFNAAKRQMNADDKLFFSSSFSVRSGGLAELKSELRDLLLRYVDVSETAEGDKVVSLVCALH